MRSHPFAGGAAPRWPDIVLWCLIVLVCVVRIVPFTPDMPQGGLDGSWRYALEQGMANGMVLGRDLVFTFGPYSSVYTSNYHPATQTLMMLASVSLALAYALTLGLFIGPDLRCRSWLLAMLVAIGGLVYFNDSMLFLLPLLVGLQVLRRWTPAGADCAAGRTAPAWLLALLVAPFGLLPLVKGTLLVLCAMVALLCAGYLWALRRRWLAALCLGTPASVLPLLWVAAGQPLDGLADYFIRMSEIVSGYNEAMAYYGVLRESLPFAIAAVVLLWAVLRLPALARAQKCLLALLYGGVLFIAFKAGFVRQDMHTVIASTVLLMAAFSLNMLVADRRVMVATAVVLVPWLLIDHHYENTTPAKLLANITQQFAKSGNGALRRLREADWPRSQFEATVRDLRAQAGLPLLAGGSDIYSYNQTALIASGNRWSPRPVPQSYSAYTPELARLNRDFLLGPHAPENIFFSVETIDRRLPSLDDGPSWPILLQRYAPAGTPQGMLLLKRRADRPSPPSPVTEEKQFLFGQAVPLPGGAARLYAQFDIKPTLLGRLAGLVFRTSQIELQLTLADGTRERYRLIPGMAKAGFLLSPHVARTTEFAALYGDAASLRGKHVGALSIHTAKGFQWLWQDSYTLRWQVLPAP